MPKLDTTEGIKSRILFFAFVFCIILFALIGRLYYVQIVRHDYYFAEAQKVYTATREVVSKRGEIRDRNGNVLVGNQPGANICVDPQEVKSDIAATALADIFSKVLDMPKDEALERINRRFVPAKREDGTIYQRENRYVVIRRGVPYDQVTELKKQVKSYNDKTSEYIKEQLKSKPSKEEREQLLARSIKGLIVEENYIRYYPKNQLLANILGVTGTNDQDEFVAVFGIEKIFNERIAASSATYTVQRSRRGPTVSAPDQLALNPEVKPQDGYNIYLTIDEVIQSYVEEELDKVMVDWEPEAVCAVMADPKTGNILAIAQRPTFNPNNRKDVKVKDMLIFPLQRVYEPGSTMKALTVSTALDFNAITPQTMVDCENGFWVYKRSIMRDTSAKKMLSVTDVVKKSSNIGTAKVALELGKYRLNLGLRKFGIGERTGLPFKNEVRGRLAPPARWDGVQITRVGIGYSVNVTPVQMVRAYCALANNGLLPKLRIVDHLEDPETGDIIPNPTEEPYQVFQKPDTCPKIVKMLIGVTEKGGTGTRAAVQGYNVAAKTGTSFKYDEKTHRYNKEKYHASIVGFVPAENPSFVLLIMVDGPKGKRSYGGAVAGSYFKNIATRTLQYLQVKPFSPVNGRINSGSNDYNDYEQEYSIERDEYMPPDENHEPETDDEPNTLGLPPGPDGQPQPSKGITQP